MPRLLFEKTGNAVWISHLDLMRVFQRAFKRAGLPLTHTKGFNPRPSVSIALPLSVGIESGCELLDFDLDGEGVPGEEILCRLNRALIAGVRVMRVYEQGDKLKNLAYLDCSLTLEYDRGIPEGAAQQICRLFASSEIPVEKKSKNGITVQNIAEMIRRFEVCIQGPQELAIHARICCQNPTLNPMQIVAAIEKFIPELTPNHVRCRRMEIYDTHESIFR